MYWAESAPPTHKSNVFPNPTKPMIKINTRTFFYSRKVLRLLDKKTHAGLKRFGSYVRTTARRSIKPVGKSGQPSKPGQPPKSRRGLLKNFIFYGFDLAKRSVVIGPQKIVGLKGKIPNVLEYGGNIKNKSKHRTVTSSKVSARPYMGPAFKKAKKQLSSLWSNNVLK